MAIKSTDHLTADRMYDAKLPLVFLIIEEDEMGRVRVAAMSDMQINVAIQYGSIRGHKPGIVTSVTDNDLESIKTVEQVRTKVEDMLGQCFNLDKK